MARGSYRGGAQVNAGRKAGSKFPGEPGAGVRAQQAGKLARRRERMRVAAPLVLRQMSYTDIAKRLGVSARTIGSYTRLPEWADVMAETRREIVGTPELYLAPLVPVGVDAYTRTLNRGIKDDATADETRAAALTAQDVFDRVWGRATIRSTVDVRQQIIVTFVDGREQGHDVVVEGVSEPVDGHYMTSYSEPEPLRALPGGGSVRHQPPSVAGGAPVLHENKEPVKNEYIVEDEE